MPPHIATLVLSAPFHKFGLVFRQDRSLTVAAPIRAARVSKRCSDTRTYVRNWVLSSLVVPWAAFLFLGVLHAEQHDHGHDLGHVYFPVSCAPTAQQTFERGVALLHSFWYDEAEKA